MPRRKVQPENFAVLRPRQVKFDYDFDLNSCHVQNDGRTFTLMLDMRNFLKDEVDVQVSPTKIKVTGRQFHDLECSESVETYPLPPGIAPHNVDCAFNEQGIIRLQAPIEYQGGPKKPSTPESGRSRTSSDARSQEGRDSPDRKLQRIQPITIEFLPHFGPGLEAAEDLSNMASPLELGSMIQVKLPTGPLGVDNVKVQVSPDWILVSGNGKPRRFKMPENMVVGSMTGMVDRQTKALMLTGLNATRVKIEESDLDLESASIRDRIGQLLNANIKAAGQHSSPGEVIPTLTEEQEQEIMRGLVERQKKAMGLGPGADLDLPSIPKPQQKTQVLPIAAQKQVINSIGGIVSENEYQIPPPPPPPQQKPRELFIRIDREGDAPAGKDQKVVSIQPRQLLADEGPENIGSYADISNDLQLPDDIKQFKVEFKVLPFQAEDIGVNIYKNTVTIDVANPKINPGIHKLFKFPTLIKPEDIRVTLFRDTGTLRISSGIFTDKEDVGTMKQPGSGNIVRKLEVLGYKPSEIDVSFENNWVVVRGLQEGTAENSFRSREFMKKFTLPADVQISDLICTQNPDGNLIFERK